MDNQFDHESSSTGLEIAVIGMDGKFPGAENIEQYWNNLCEGKESISFFTLEELLAEGLDKEIITDKNYVKAKGVLKGIEKFDAAFFNYTPKEAQVMDPQFRLLHECCYHALEDAGYDSSKYAGDIGLFVGAHDNYEWMSRVRGDLDNHILNSRDYLATRISYKLNLTGPSMTVLSACSTSLLAIHNACQSILGGECDMAVAGGVSLSIPNKMGYMHEEGMILSSDGHCRPFDAKANGTVPGDGVGTVVLKSLEKALEDNDHIYATIKGSAINNDGNRKVGYTAPSPIGQEKVLQDALDIAEVSPESIGYIESHGTGTQLGDPIEIRALKKVYEQVEPNNCSVGSVKGNIGHLNVSSGVASFIKAVLSIHNKTIVPTVNFNDLNTEIELENSPFKINTSLVPWESKKYPLRAGVSSFGFGGTNAHIILEEAPEVSMPNHVGEDFAFLWSATTKDALQEKGKQLLDFLERNKTIGLENIAYTLTCGRRHFSFRNAVVCNSYDQLVKKITSIVDRKEGQISNPKQKNVSLLFPGNDAIYKGMANDLSKKYEAFKNCFDQVKESAKVLFKIDLSHGDVNDKAQGDEAIDNLLERYVYQFAIQFSLAKQWLAWGLNCKSLFCDGIGEITASCVAELLTIDQALSLIIRYHNLENETIQYPHLDNIGSDAIPEFIPLDQLEMGLYFRSMTFDANAAEINVNLWLNKILSKCSASPNWELADDKVLLFILGTETAALNTFVPEALLEKSMPCFPSVVVGQKPNVNHQISKCLQSLYLTGFSLDWEAYFSSFAASRISLPTYPFQHVDYWVDAVNANHNALAAGENSSQKKRFNRPDLITPFKSPSSEIEEQLSAIWASIFQYDRIGVDDDYFELGGDSLKAVDFVNKIKVAFETDISISEFINNGTVANLAIFIKNASKNSIANKVYPTIIPDKANISAEFPLNDIQLAYLMGRNNSVELGGVATHSFFELPFENLDLERLEFSVNQVINRHGMLRAIITDNGTQKILPQVESYKICTIDISELNDDQKQLALIAKRDEMSHRVFKADQWPLFDIQCVKVDEAISHLLMGIDLLISDGFSMEIMVKEINAFYQNPSLILPPLTLSFRDYIIALNDLKKSEDFENAKSFWMNKLATFPTAPNLPGIQDLAKVGSPEFKLISKKIKPNQYEKLKHYASTNGVTIPSILCNAYADVLSLWCNQNHFALNLTLFNRLPLHQEVNQIVGDFTSLLLLEVSHQSGNDFLSNTKSLQQSLFDAIDHRLFDGVSFMREISKYHGYSNKAIMPVVFTCLLFDGISNENFALLNDQKGEKSGDQGEANAAQTPQVLLDNIVQNDDDYLTISWNFVENALDPVMIECMFDQYTTIIESLCEGEELSPSIPEEHKKEIIKYNETNIDFESLTLVQPFQNQVKINPNATAIIHGNKLLSYKDLDDRSNQVANFLLANGLAPQQCVGVEVPREIDTIVYILGILKAGGIYVPVEDNYPEERKSYIIEDSDCKLFLKKGQHGSAIKKFPTTFSADHKPNPTDIAYIIYTSGTTGKPKGVVISHEAAFNTIFDINHRYNVDKNDGILGLSSMCFDLSVYDIFGALAAGASTIVIENQRDIEELLNALNLSKATIWNSVPSIMNMLIAQLDESYENTSINTILLSGDWIPVFLPEKIKKHFPKAKVVSLGGATEGSIWSIYYEINEVSPNWRSIPYGYPLANQQIHVLNENRDYCPFGVKGDIFIGGKGVANGYLNQLQKTKNSFLNHPDLGRIYKTGDEGIFHRNGYVEIIGRKDFQVKIGGYRIEIGEIDWHLNQIDSIKEAVVTVKEDGQKNKVLAAYYIKNNEINEKEIVHYLREKLPEYMIPVYFVEVDEFPLTSNKKVNRAALPDPKDTIKRSGNTILPQTAYESRLLDLWANVLCIPLENISVDDSFFELGGNSLSATNMIASIFKEFKVRVPLMDTFRFPTIIEMAKYLEEKQPGHFIDISIAAKKKYYATSSAQKRMYTIQVAQPENTMYNITNVYWVKDGITISDLEVYFTKIIERHESLRTSFKVINGEIVQLIHDNTNFQIQMVTDDSLTIDDMIKKFVAPFDLHQSNLLRVGILQPDDGNRYLAIDMHHIVTDGISNNVLLGELLSQYLAMPLNDLELQYKDFTEWLHQDATIDLFDKQQSFWENQFANGIPTLDLPLDYSRQQQQSFEGATLSFDVESDQFDSIRRFTQTTNSTMYVVVLGIFNVLLAKLCNQEKVIVGTIAAGRRHPALEKMLGMFVNTIPIMTAPEGKLSFVEFIEKVKVAALSAFDHQEYPFEEIVSRFSSNRDSGRNPIFDVMFDYHNEMNDWDKFVKEKDIQIPIEPYTIKNSSTLFDLNLHVIESKTKLHFRLDYCIDLFEEETVQMFIEGFKFILSKVLEDGHIKLELIQPFAQTKSVAEDFEFNF